MKNTELPNKVVVITGASSGFGKGAALKFASLGASLVLAARRENLLERLAVECRGFGVKVMVRGTDVSDPEQVQRLMEVAYDGFNGFDVWVNDAGVGAVGRFDEIPVADHLQLVATNLMGTIYGSHAALRLFKHRRSGTLINVASALGKIPAPYYASYTASKYAIVGLGAALRQELKEEKFDKVHVCTVMPMAMDTPFFEHAANYTGRQAVPIPPVYDAQKVVDVIVNLAETPEDEVIVGGAGKIFNAAHQIMPGGVENFMAAQTHKTQIEQAPPAQFSTGALHQPTQGGTEICGGWLKK